MSSDSRATIVQITNKTPHPNADTLSIVNVLGDGSEGSGYPVVVKTDAVQIGDLALYVPVDMVCPDRPCFSFLGGREKDRRIEAKRLRGIFSMGLIIPARDLPIVMLEQDLPQFVSQDDFKTLVLIPATGAEVWSAPILAARTEGKVSDRGHFLGMDLTDILGFTKYEPPIQYARSMTGPGGKYIPGETEFGISATVCPKYTDIENARRWPTAFYEGETVIMTEKVHGANARFVFADDRMIVGSHGRFVLPDSAGLWPDLARKYKLVDVLRQFPGMALYGEAFGYVQDLRYGLGTDVALAAFDIMDTSEGKYLDHDAFVTMLDAMNDVLATLGGSDQPLVLRVPVLYRGPWLGLAAHKALAEGQSVIGIGACIREGVVVRPERERVTHGLGRTILKIVGETYLMRNRKVRA